MHNRALGMVMQVKNERSCAKKYPDIASACALALTLLSDAAHSEGWRSSARRGAGVGRANAVAPLLFGLVQGLVRSAQGQCPASNSPSMPRLAHNPANVSTRPLMIAAADHTSITNG